MTEYCKFKYYEIRKLVREREMEEDGLGKARNRKKGALEDRYKKSNPLRHNEDGGELCEVVFQ